MIRRFFRSFFWALLLGFTLAWLYLGWVSASTREAVLIEDRYDGISPDPVLPGSFRFVPERAVPGRVTLHRVYLGPRILKWRYKHGLSQSETLGLDDTFFIRLELRLEYKIDPARLPLLFLELDRPDFRRLSAYLRFRLRLVSDRFIKSIYTSDAVIPNLESQIQNWLRDGTGLLAFNQELTESGISIERLIPVRVYVPDQNRYRAMLNLGRQALLGLKLERIRRINEARIDRDTSRIRDHAYFARLTKLGRLLRNYPHLREYVGLELMGDKVRVLVLPQERVLESPQGHSFRSSLPSLLRNRNLQNPNSIQGLIERSLTPELQGDKTGNIDETEQTNFSDSLQDRSSESAVLEKKTQGLGFPERPGRRAHFQDLTPQ